MSSIHTLTIQDGDQAGLIIAISSVTQLTEVFSGTATENPTANRQSVTDHYITHNPLFSFSGVISGILNPKDLTLQDSNTIVDNLKSTIESAKLVTFFSGQNRAVKDCYVERLTLSRTTAEGLKGWKIDCSLKKIKVATGGKETIINVIPDQSANKTDVHSSSTTDKGQPVQYEGTGRSGFSTRASYIHKGG